MNKLNLRISNRELEVLENIIEGFTDVEIGKGLHISSDTVNAHRNKLKLKLGAVNVASLVAHAFRKGLVR